MPQVGVVNARIDSVLAVERRIVFGICKIMLIELLPTLAVKIAHLKWSTSD